MTERPKWYIVVLKGTKIVETLALIDIDSIKSCSDIDKDVLLRRAYDFIPGAGDYKNTFTKALNKGYNLSKLERI